MITDLVAVSEALLLWVLILFIPGYVFAWLLDALDFRRRALLARCAISLPLAIAIVPIVTYHLWRWSLAAVWVMYASCLMSFAALLFHERHILSVPAPSRKAAGVLAIIGGWFVLATLLLVDLQLGNRIYFPLAAYDYTLRTAITASITNTGIPPHNPYFFYGQPFTLRYHYFWLMLCSLVDQLGGATVTARHAILAGTVWCGAGLMALVTLYLRFFQSKGSKDLDRRMLIGILLLCVTGLDIVPILIASALSRHLFESLTAAIPPWVNSLLWVPHYVASLIACLTGFLLLRYHSTGSLSRRVMSSVAAGLALASAAGLGIYVVGVFAVFMMVWLTIALVKRNWCEGAIVCVSGIVALAAAAPYLIDLRGAGSGPGSSGFPIGFAVRPFLIADVMLETFLQHPGWREPFMNALLLPLNYFLGLGFSFVAGIVQWKRIRRGKAFLDSPELCGLIMASTSLLICSFFRSSVISINDLGYRGILIAQFILLIWAADLWDEMFVAAPAAPTPRPKDAGKDRRTILTCLVVLGVAGTVYEASMFRFFPVISDRLPDQRYAWLSNDQNLGERTYALRQVYDWLRHELPIHAIVQHNPNAVPGDMFYGLYADRQAAAETRDCGVVFGGDPSLCAALIGRINELFEKPGAVNADRVDQICRDLSIDALVVKDTDKVWADRNSWVWKRRPQLANEYARVFLCGAAGMGGDR